LKITSKTWRAICGKTVGLPALYSKEKVEDPIVKLKLFNPVGVGTWYITEASARIDGEYVALSKCKITPQGVFVWMDNGIAKPVDDVIAFGWVDLGDPEFAELGYISLRELAEVRCAFGLRIERDTYFTQVPLSKVQKRGVQ
jgi:hypothetical protein